MIASKKEEVFRIFDLVGQQEADGLEALLSSVDVVAQEQVVRLGGEAAVLEQAEQVRVLTVDVA
jgi:hypothetical protein